MTLSMGILDLEILLQALKMKPYVMPYLAPKSQKGKLEWAAIYRFRDTSYIVGV